MTAYQDLRRVTGRSYGMRVALRGWLRQHDLAALRWCEKQAVLADGSARAGLEWRRGCPNAAKYIGADVRAPPPRHWRSYGADPQPTPAEAVLEPMRAFPSWFLRIECDRCGKVVMHNEVHMTPHQRRIVLRVLLSRMRHDGCGGRVVRAELMTGIEAASSRPVRRIVLMSG